VSPVICIYTVKPVVTFAFYPALFTGGYVEAQAGTTVIVSVIIPATFASVTVTLIKSNGISTTLGSNVLSGKHNYTVTASALVNGLTAVVCGERRKQGWNNS
jgi:hypothetical protein